MDDATRLLISDAVNNQPQSTVTVLSSLLAVEDAIGYIPREAVEAVALRMDATVNDVWAVATFYPNFRFEPPTEHRIEVCWGPSCHVMGATAIIAAAQDALNLPDEGDTPDGKATLRYNTCLGACAHAPVMAIDHHLAGRITPESARERIATALESGAAH
ncbi:MAG: NAD(P)H-dependent oxidoreductase subunit E [Chloroflexi bacterium]|nr:NAD(P)H-dependent oxidoreductase subunit E [Chloroflexota bacterium]MYD47481.1 NAD(P)H-dependent oxidoreductase subunit E [Chloroflexota bacterium]